MNSKILWVGEDGACIRFATEEAVVYAHGPAQPRPGRELLQLIVSSIPPHTQQEDQLHNNEYPVPACGKDTHPPAKP